MYINAKKENTNIDKEFKNKKQKKQNIEKYKVPMILGGVLILIILVIIAVVMLSRPKYFIMLIGPEEISMYEGNEYNELGYIGKDNKGNDVTDQVKVINNIDVNSPGSYEIIYKLKKTTKRRKVNVVEKGIGITSIFLKGENNVVIGLGSKYEEPGYKAIDSVDGDISEKVKVENQVDTSKKGTYRVIYTVVNSSNVTTKKVRTVIVK